MGWQDIEVTKALGGRPGARLYGGARRLEEEYGSLDVLLSLTHTDSAAAAVAIVTVARRGKMEREARKKRASTVGLKKRSS